MRTLAFVDSGVQQAEDAPFVTTEYQFLPGEYVYITFHIAGYAVKVNEEKDLRNMDVSYKVAVQDQQGVLLAAPETGEINPQLGSEDKNWTPSKQFSFLLPSFVADGNYVVHLSAKDQLASAEASKDLTFHIHGARIAPSDSITVQDFRFLRQEGSNEALETPAYTPGDTVFTQFDLTGFAVGDGNTYKVAYGITVLNPEGKVFLDEPDAAKLSDKSFYPARYLPCTLNVTTEKSSRRGEYTMVLTVRDALTGRTAVTRRTFTLE